MISFTLAEESDFESGTIQVGMVVSDLQKSVDFYKNVVGMEETGGFSVDNNFSKKSGLTDGKAFDVTVLKLKNETQATEWKLMSFGNKANHPRPEFIDDDTGIQYVTIFVKSMAPFIERIKAHKVKMLDETPVYLEDGRQFVLIQDPDGTFVELIGPDK